MDWRKELKDIHPMKWIIFSLSGAFYFYEFFIRITPSIITTELMETFGVTAGDLGQMSAYYFYAIAPMQMVAGLLMDRYGARNLLVFATGICAVGEIFFGAATELWMANLGRVFMGAGSAFGFVGLIYIISHWFPFSVRGRLIAVGNGIGLLGAVCGQGPTRFAVNAFGWRHTCFMLSALGFLLALLIFVVVKNEPEEMKGSHEDPEPLSETWKHFLSVFKTPNSWIGGTLSLLFYATISAFTGLWAVRFISTAYDVSTATAGFTASMIYVGMLVGGPVLGHYSDILHTRKPIFHLTGIAGILSILAVIFLNKLSIYPIIALLFVVGFCTASQILTYGISIDANTDKAKGTAIALVNTIVFGGAAVLQPLVGWLLDLKWDGKMENGVPSYSLEDYHTALLVFPASFLLAMILTLFLKEDKPVGV